MPVFRCKPWFLILSYLSCIGSEPGNRRLLLLLFIIYYYYYLDVKDRDLEIEKGQAGLP